MKIMKRGEIAIPELGMRPEEKPYVELLINGKSKKNKSINF